MSYNTRDDAVARDNNDPLASFRDRFTLPEGTIYLDGNSLGAMPTATAERISDVVNKEWALDLIKSWNVNDWYPMPRRCGNKIAKLVGADDDEVISADSTSVN